MKFIAVENEKVTAPVLTFPKGTVVYSTFAKLQEAVAKKYPGVDDDNFTVYHCKDEDTKFFCGVRFTKHDTEFYIGLPKEMEAAAEVKVEVVKKRSNKNKSEKVKTFDSEMFKELMERARAE